MAELLPSETSLNLRLAHSHDGSYITPHKPDTITGNMTFFLTFDLKISPKTSGNLSSKLVGGYWGSSYVA